MMQTNLDPRRRRRRRYRLSPAGLASLRASALRRRLWERSTGPRTEMGKSRSKLNALKHGEYSLARRAERRQLNESIRQLLAGDAAPLDSAEAWRGRVAMELEDGISRLLKRKVKLPRSSLTLTMSPMR